jgi:hypothetical protein
MGFSKQDVARLKQKLQDAPEREPRRTLAAIIAELQPALIEARRRKNWTLADIRAWLEAEGVKISMTALRKYLGRGSRERGNKAATAEQVISVKPPTKAPLPTSAPRSGAAFSDDPAVRASSFRVRRDREDI